MERFGIDLKASDKGERKEVIKYLKSKGLRFIDFDRWRNRRWSYLFVSDCGFCYTSSVTVITFTLPRDWNKLKKIIEEGKPTEQGQLLPIDSVIQRSELLLFADYLESDKTSQTTDECVDNYLAQKQ